MTNTNFQVEIHHSISFSIYPSLKNYPADFSTTANIDPGFWVILIDTSGIAVYNITNRIDYFASVWSRLLMDLYFTNQL